jgi:hypothetical protein
LTGEGCRRTLSGAFADLSSAALNRCGMEMWTLPHRIVASAPAASWAVTLPERCRRSVRSVADGMIRAIVMEDRIPAGALGPEPVQLDVRAYLVAHAGGVILIDTSMDAGGLARSIIAETGLDMGRFPTAAHLVSWAGLCPRARQSGPRTRSGKKNQGDSWLRGALGQAATGAARTSTFLGERYGRIARRRGKAKAQVAVARSILIIISLAPARQPRRPVHRPRLRLLPGPPRHRPQAP